MLRSRSPPPSARPGSARSAGTTKGFGPRSPSLLDQDERAARDGFLPASEPPCAAPGRTATLTSPDGRRPPPGPAPIDRDGDGDGDGDATHDTTVFSPRAAIAAGSRPQPISAAESTVRARLRELPMIYILIVAMATFYRNVVLSDR